MTVRLRNFKATEFPEPLEYADPVLLTNLDDFRDFARFPVYPSPVPGGLARFDLGHDDSQHYAVGRLSTAVDFFCYADPFEAWAKLIKCKLFNRVGIYFDTFYKHRKWIMFHADTKDHPLMWYRVDKKYYYSTDPNFYNGLFKNFFLNRENRR
jgi:hypothetical protein